MNIPILTQLPSRFAQVAQRGGGGRQTEDPRMANQSEANCTEVPRAEAIARLNDQLRKTGAGGTVMITQNVRNITGFAPAVLEAALANYRDFDAHGDPHGERDFGTMTLWGYDLIWKVDYYDKDVNYGSDDPADPQITHRVLTVLLATEW